ncbi:CLUMA_CG010657, isoform A [Clunio marinus]|uniref:CLUMA_CG010657, isoform A n=1 Tax=Clunio marinus TaxID=568069 RepID=A0A1J1IAE9_9DIPT|nr:CLUMA_CG010657, isoform A [Clunio marinus]
MAEDDCAIKKITSDNTFYHDEAKEEEEDVTEIHYDDDDDKTGIQRSYNSEGDIQLETPLESHGVSVTSADSSNVKPKRLSDEFSSLDEEIEDIDDDDDDEDDRAALDVKNEVACCSKGSSLQELDDNSDPPDICEKAETSSSCVSLCFSNSSNNMFVQSLDDAIERADFENEQKLTGGIIIKASSLTDANDRLKFDLISRRSAENDEINPTPSSSSQIGEVSMTKEKNVLTSTPTSSRCNAISANDLRNKSTIRSKQKLSDKYLSVMKTTAGGKSSTIVSGDELTKKSSNDNENSVEIDTKNNKTTAEHSKNVKINLFDDEPSTSSGHQQQQSHQHQQHEIKATNKSTVDECIKSNDDYVVEQSHEHQHIHLSDDIIDDDTWADCEEGSDNEEVCTCQNYSDDDYGASSSSSEDELPSRDVDLSSYTQLDSISDDILQESSDGTPKIQRKRKLTEQSIIQHSSTNESPIALGTNRKRLALDTLSSSSPSSLTNLATPKSTSIHHDSKRTPRLIPTKENPPPELMEWLLQFQRWTNAERLVAVDKLIEQCEPTQVRHMMKVIEPQFQRDFISLLPKELALHVLSYLAPKDLLRAAQTCRSWRFLADDNLLWKEKCKQSGIITKSSPSFSDKPKRGRTGNMPKIASAWKAAFMRHNTIETNWRSNPIRTPKILNGHDDHVITCLQFCGNRIVSGSDDNTLKVWSAVTGKCLRTLIGHTGGVWSSQMSSEGNIIISGSTDRTLKVWDADSGLCRHTLYGHTSTVRCMHLYGTRVVSGSRDATLRVWDITDGACLHILVGHLAAVRCVQYDGKLVVSGAYDYMVKVWNPERQECLHTLQGHTNRVYSLQFDGVHVVSGSLDTSIRVWDAESGSLRHTLMGHQSLTSGMELKNNILVSGNADSTVKVWDILTGQCLATLAGRNKHHSAVTCLQFNNKFVITSSDDGTVKLWDVKTGEFIRNLVALDSGGSGGVVWRIRANDTKLICAVGSRNGTEETKLMVLDFDVEGACSKCS